MAGNEYDRMLGPGDANEYDALLLDEQKATKSRVLTGLGQPVEPDRQAAVLDLAGRSGLPADVVERNYDTIQAAQARRELPYEAMERQTPGLVRWLAQRPENAAVAKDDLPRLGWLEWMSTAPVKAFRQGQAQVEMGGLAYSSIFSDLSAGQQQRLGDLEKASGGDLGEETWFGKFLTGGSRQVPQLLEQTRRGLNVGLPLGMAMGGTVALAGQAGPQVLLPEEIATVPVATATGIGLGIASQSAQFSFEQEAGLAYREFTQAVDENGERMDPTVAKMGALAAGAINSGLEVGAVGVLLKSIPGADKLVGPLGRKAVREVLQIPTVRAALLESAKSYGGVLAKETAIEVAQRAVTIMAGEIGKWFQGMEGRDAGDIGVDLGQEAVSAVQAFGYLAAPGPVAHGVLRSREAQLAQRRAEYFQALGEGVKDSKLAQRLPAEVRAMVAEATKDGPLETVYVPIQEWQTLLQAKELDPGKVAVDITGSREAYDESVATGGDLAIPMADYAAKIAPTELNAALAKVLRIRPGEMNAAEAEEFIQQQAQQPEVVGVEQDPRQAIREDITGQLLASGYDRGTAEAMAEVQARFYGAMGERTGQDPADLFRRYGVNVQTEVPQVLQRVGSVEALDNVLDRYRAGQIPTDRQAYGETVTEFIRRMGGIRPDEAVDQGELKARDLGKIGRGLRPLLNKSSAKNLEQMAEVAHEAGYIQNYDYHELLDAIDRDLAGEKVYSTTGGAGSSREAGDASLRDQRDLFDQLGRWLDEQGIDISQASNAEIKARLLTPQGQTLEQPAYHGSPHRFEKFDLSKIGTGEGAQAYGWGLYFAESMDVAKSYAPRDFAVEDKLMALYKSAEQREDVDAMTVLESALMHKTPGELRAQYPEAGQLIDRIEKITAKAASGLYQVDIPDEAVARMLDWDRPLANQPANVKAALKKAGLWAEHRAARSDFALHGTSRVDKGSGLYSYLEQKLGGQREASMALSAIGIPGLRYLDADSRDAGRGTRNVVIWDQAVLDKMNEEVRTLYQQDQAAGPVYYSGLIRAVENSKLTKGTPEQWINTLKNTPGIKAEELEWYDLPAALAGQKSVTREQILELLRANELKVTEEVRGGIESSPEAEAAMERIRAMGYDIEGEDPNDPPVLVDGEGHILDTPAKLRDVPQQVLDDFDFIVKNDRPPRYWSYQTPGGDNYTELLLTLPLSDNLTTRDTLGEPNRITDRKQMSEAWGQNVEDMGDNAPVAFIDYPKVGAYILEEEDGTFTVQIFNKEYPFSSLEAAEKRLVEEFVLAEGIVKTEDYVNPHFDTRNVIAHVRFNEREDSEGRKVLLLEEVQSDWHQQGRRYGYRKPTVSPWEAFKAKGYKTAKEGAFWMVYDYNGDPVAEGSTEQAAIADLVERDTQNVTPMGAANESGVPDAPFKTTWPELAMKRMVRWGAEHGFDLVAWTTGEQQADRYDLSKQVDRIVVLPRTDARTGEVSRGVAVQFNGGKYLTLGVDNAGMVDNASQGDFKGKPLADVLGKEMADKIMGVERATFEGGDLKIGGEGMRGFYDKILPSVASKLGKKYGAKVGTITISAPVLGPEDTVQVHALTITPELRAAAMAGQALFQPADGGTARGSVTFPADRSRFDIRLMKDANLSTFLHESGHQFLEIMGELASAPGAPADLVQDYQALLDWFGVKSREEIQVKHHEQFARGFEAYLMEGKAPSTALRSMFAKFRAWLVAIYRKAGLGVQLTPEVRKVMDRMLATEEEIAAAEAEAEIRPIFATAEEAGMSEVQFAAYRGLARAAGDEAREKLQARLMADLVREQKAWWKAERAKVRQEVEDEVNTRREYFALALLQTGTTVDGGKLPEGLQPIKLNKAALEKAYGKANRPTKRGTFQPNTLMNTLRGLRVWAPDGLHPDAAASYLGYESGEALVLALVNARPRVPLIEAETDARMQERYPDIRFDGTLADEARAAVRNEKGAEVLEAELRALRRREREVRPFVRAAVQEERQRAQAAAADAQDQARQADKARREARAAGLQAIRTTTPSVDTLRTLAQQIIARRRVRDIRPDVFMAAARRYARRALETAARGAEPIKPAPKSGWHQPFESGYAAAADAKQQELLNHLLYLEALKAREQIDGTLEFVKQANGAKSRARLAKAGYLAQWDEILGRFSFARTSLKKADERVSLAAWVSEQEAAGLPVNLSPAVLDEARREPYVNLTFEELLGVRDSLKQIRRMATLATKIRKAADAFEWEVAQEALLERALASSPGGKGPPVSVYEDTGLRRFGRAAVEFADAALRPETLIEWLDGGTSGPWHDYFWNGANEAEYGRETLRKEVSEPLKDLVAKMSKARRRAMFDTLPIASLGMSLNRRTLISMALNLGNAGNRERLMKGGIRVGAEIRQLDETAVNEIIRVLNAEDWAMVQTIWDTVDKLWPKIRSFEERMTGQAPERVEATPVVTPHGEFRGGYFPAVYDPFASRAGQKQAEADTSIDKLFSNFTQAATGKGHTKARTGVGGPLLLDFERVIGRHVDQVITDLTHREWVIGALKILNDRKLRLAIQDRQGATAWASLQGMIRHAVHSDYGFNDAADRMLSRMADRTISNTAVAALGFKIMTAVGNLALAPIQAAARVSPADLLRGFAEFYANPTGMAEFVHERSEMMRHRAANMDASFVEILQKLRGEAGWRPQVARVAMSVHRVADWIGVHGIWMGAYQQALRAGELEAEAVRLADKAIRTTQTAGGPKDLAALERSPLLRKSGLTLFLGPMVIMGNRLREAAQRRGVVKSWPEAFGTMLAVWFLPAILWPLATGKDLGGDDDDPTDEGLYLLRQVFLYPFLTLPVFREVATAIDFALSGKRVPMRGNPIVDAASLVVDAGRAAAKAGGQLWEGDEPDVETLVKKSLRAAGPLAGIPTGQPLITGEFLYDTMTGQFDPETPLDWRYLVVQRPAEKR